MLGRLLENELRSSDERPRIRLAGQSMRHCERRVRDALGSVDDELRPDPDARSASRPLALRHDDAAFEPRPFRGNEHTFARDRSPRKMDDTPPRFCY